MFHVHVFVKFLHVFAFYSYWQLLSALEFSPAFLNRKDFCYSLNLPTDFFMHRSVPKLLRCNETLSHI